MASTKESAAGGAKTTLRPRPGVLVRRQGRTHSLCDPGYRLICLNAKNGIRVGAFGDKGEVDLKRNDDQEILPDLATGEIGIQSAPVVAKDTVIIGAAFREGMTPRSMRNNKGYVRGFDVRTGKRLWISTRFRTRASLATTRGRRVRRNTRATPACGHKSPRMSNWDWCTCRLKRRPAISTAAPSGKQFVRRKPGVRGPENRRAQVAFPAGSSPALGHGYLLGADSC